MWPPWPPFPGGLTSDAFSLCKSFVVVASTCGICMQRTDDASQALLLHSIWEGNFLEREWFGSEHALPLDDPPWVTLRLLVSRGALMPPPPNPTWQEFMTTYH